MITVGKKIKIPDIGPEATVLAFRKTDVLVEIDGDEIWIPKEFLELVTKNQK